MQVGMVFRTRTTFSIDDGVMASLRLESARTGQTMSMRVETALRQFFEDRQAMIALPPLPTFDLEGSSSTSQIETRSIG